MSDNLIRVPNDETILNKEQQDKINEAIANGEEINFLTKDVAVTDKGDLIYLNTLCQKLTIVRNRTVDLELQIADLKELEKQLSEVAIPEFFQSKGLTSITLEDGQKVEITEDLYVSIPKTDFIAAEKYFAFIIENGGESIIKENLEIDSPEMFIKEFLALNKIPYKEKKDVHPQTLKAWFKDILGMKKNSVAKVELSKLPKEIKYFISKKTKIK